MAEFNVTVVHTTSGKEVTVAVEPSYTISSLLDVLAEGLHLKDRFVLANKATNQILGSEATIEECGIKEGDTLLLMPDPTGG